VTGPGRDRTVDLGLGSRIHYVDYRGPADGPVLVLVHGLGGSHLNWELLAPLLTDRARVLVLDQPGFGLSRPTGRPATVARNVPVLDRFVRQVAGRPSVVVGNSMGGMIAILLAARSPSLVHGLALVAPVLVPPDPGGVPWRAVRALPTAVPVLGELLTRRHRRRIGAVAVVLETLDLCGVDPATLPTGTIDRAIDLVARRDDVAGADRALLSAARSVGWTLAHAGRYRAEIDAVTTPVLLVQGDRDRLAPVEAARVTARRHPGWRYVELAGVGHLPQLQVPDVLAVLLLDWLDRDVPRPTLPRHADLAGPEPGTG